MAKRDEEEIEVEAPPDEPEDDSYVEVREQGGDRDEDEDDGPVDYGVDDPADIENLVPLFVSTKAGQKFLKQCADDRLEEIDAAWEGSEEYRQRKAADWKLFTGDLPDKPLPFKGCANVHVPIFLKNIMTITSQVAAEIFGDWQNVFGVVPLGPGDDMVANILTVHGGWQIREQIPDFKRQIGARAPLAFFAHGDVTTHSFYDPVEKVNCHEVLTPDEFIVPYTHTTTRPDYGDVP